jgi:ABC-2 type transport system ATP-binding protein
MSITHMIHLTDLCIQRGGRDVLSGLNLSVAPGEIYALLGGNGAGKSTTLAILLGFLKAGSGSVSVAGLDPASDADAVRHKIAYLPENVALYEHLTARENVDYFLALAGEAPSVEERETAFDAAGLQTEARDRRLSGFSKGMRQKVAIALAVVRQVPVLLLDEPTSGLDPRATADFNALIGRLKDRGTAILMVTHDLLGAADCADRIGFLDNGRIIEEVARADGYDVMALHRRYGEAVAA